MKPNLKTASLIGLAALASAAGVASIWFAPRERLVASYATSLRGRSKSQSMNAIRALLKLDGAVIEPGAVFSFNRRVGSFSRDDGYRKAPVSYNGQLIDSWGGGVCETSTTLYNAALLAGMDIVERTHHEFCPSYVSPGRDAAVAYSAIDLKFRNPYDVPVQIRAWNESGLLRISFLASKDRSSPIQVYSVVTNIVRPVEFTMGTPGSQGRVRNSGKPGYEVAVYRLEGGRKELVSKDTYPVMNRVVDFGG